MVQLVPTAGEQIVVCQCHRSCRYVEFASLFGVLPQVQFLDKVVDLPVASMTGAWVVSAETAASAVAVLTLVFMSLSCRSSIGTLLGAFSEGLVMKGGRGSSHR